MKVVIIGFFPETAKERIRASFPCAWDVRIVLPNEAEQELSDADVLIPEHILIDDEILRKAPKLKLVQTGAGYDNVDLCACTMYGVQVCNAAADLTISGPSSRKKQSALLDLGMSGKKWQNTARPFT